MVNEQEKKFRDPKKGRNLLDSFHAELVEAMETGKTLAWQEDWKGETPPLPYNGTTNNPYTGINIFLLERGKENKSDPRYYTFKQAEGMDGIKVSKGAKASKIVFFDMDNQFPQRDKKTKEIVTNSKGEPLMVKSPFIDVYNVFNGTQLEGLPLYIRKHELDDEKIERVSKLAGAVLGKDRNTQLRGKTALIAEFTMAVLDDDSRVRTAVISDLNYCSAACVEISGEIVDDLFKGTPAAELALRKQLTSYLLCRELDVAAPLQDLYEDQTYVFREEWAELLKADRKAFTKASRDASKALNKVREIERSYEKPQEQTQEGIKQNSAAQHSEKTSDVPRQPDLKIEYIRQETQPMPEAGVSAADIDAAKVTAQHIINNEMLMKGDMVNEGHEKTAVDAAIQSKQFLNDRPRQETYTSELTRIRQESGKDVKIIEGRVNKYYGPGKLKLYEKTAVLSLSRNLKVAYDINDLKGQMPEARDKEVPIRGMKLFVDRTDNKETRGIHVTSAKEKTAELER